MSLILKSFKELIDTSMLAGTLSISMTATIGVFVSATSGDDWPVYTFEEANVTRKTLTSSDIVQSHVDVSVDFSKSLDSYNFDARWTFQASNYSNINATGNPRMLLIVIANDQYIYSTYLLEQCSFPIEPFHKYNLRATIQNMFAVYQHNGTRPTNLLDKINLDLTDTFYGLRTYPFIWSFDVVMANAASMVPTLLSSTPVSFDSLQYDGISHKLYKRILKMEFSQAQLSDWLNNYQPVMAKPPDFPTGGFIVQAGLSSSQISGYLRLNGIPEVGGMLAASSPSMVSACCANTYYAFDVLVDSIALFDILQPPLSL